MHRDYVAHVVPQLIAASRINCLFIRVQEEARRAIANRMRFDRNIMGIEIGNNFVQTVPGES